MRRQIIIFTLSLLTMVFVTAWANSTADKQIVRTKPSLLQRFATSYSSFARNYRRNYKKTYKRKLSELYKRKETTSTGIWWQILNVRYPQVLQNLYLDTKLGETPNLYA